MLLSSPVSKSISMTTEQIPRLDAPVNLEIIMIIFWIVVADRTVKTMYCNHSSLPRLSKLFFDHDLFCP